MRTKGQFELTFDDYVEKSGEFLFTIYTAERLNGSAVLGVYFQCPNM